MVKMMNNTSALNEDQQSMLRNNTWQQMVMEKLMNREYEENGITVSGDELYDIMLGENISPVIRQLFQDPNTGVVDKERARMVIRQLIELPDSDPQKRYWLNMEEEIASNRKNTKYNNLLAKSLYITDEQAQENAQATASKSDISYIVKNYSTIPDSTISISNREIKDYYKENQKDSNNRRPGKSFM